VNLLSRLIEPDTLALQLRSTSAAVRLEKKADAFIKKFNTQTPSHSTLLLHAEAPRTDAIYNILRSHFNRAGKSNL
jgi:hypothetical protein